MRARSIRISPHSRLLAVRGTGTGRAGRVCAAPTPAPAEGNRAQAAGRRGCARHSRWWTRTARSTQLADYKGKWVVVYFYPKDQTPGLHHAGLRVHRERVSRSARPTRRSWASASMTRSRTRPSSRRWRRTQDLGREPKAIEEHGLPFPLLADSTIDTAKRYGVLTKFEPTAHDDRLARHLPDRPEGQGRQALQCHAATSWRVTRPKLLTDIETFKAGKG